MSVGFNMNECGIQSVRTIPDNGVHIVVGTGSYVVMVQHCTPEIFYWITHNIM